MIKFNIITIFPEAFNSYFNASILKKAQEKGLIKVNFINPRDFSNDKHRKACPPSKTGCWRCGRVDDRAYGGGPGMVMQVEPILKAILSLRNFKSQISNPKQTRNSKVSKSKSRIILFSTRGKKFSQEAAKRLSKYDSLVLICGHYEGVDERVAKYIADEEISVGDYVLTGGEIPAMTVVDAVSRFVPGVLGKIESLEDIKGSYPVYTRPEQVIINKKKRIVPKVLLSGDHKKIEEWRSKK